MYAISAFIFKPERTLAVTTTIYFGIYSTLELARCLIRLRECFVIMFIEESVCSEDMSISEITCEAPCYIFTFYLNNYIYCGHYQSVNCRYLA